MEACNLPPYTSQDGKLSPQAMISKTDSTITKRAKSQYNTTRAFFELIFPLREKICRNESVYYDLYTPISIPIDLLSDTDLRRKPTRFDDLIEKLVLPAPFRSPIANVHIRLAYEILAAGQSERPDGNVKKDTKSFDFIHLAFKKLRSSARSESTKYLLNPKPNDKYRLTKRLLGKNFKSSRTTVNAQVFPSRIRELNSVLNDDLLRSIFATSLNIVYCEITFNQELVQ